MLIGRENFCRLKSIKHSGERRGADGVLVVVPPAPAHSHPSSLSLRGRRPVMDQRLPGAVTFKPSISTLSLPQLSELSAHHKEEEETGEERGRRGHGRGWTE